MLRVKCCDFAQGQKIFYNDPSKLKMVIEVKRFPELLGESHNFEFCEQCTIKKDRVLNNNPNLILGYGKCQSKDHIQLLKTCNKYHMFLKGEEGLVFQFSDMTTKCYCCLIKYLK